jgi:type II secretory pathway component PulF
MEQTGLFAPSVITLIELGEATGHLPQNLRVVSVQMHKTNQMTSRIKSAMLYPAFLVGLLFVVGTGIGTFLLPKLLKIINGLGEKVGPITKALIFVGTYFGHYGLLMAGVVVIVGLVIGILIKMNYKARSIAETVMFHTPGVKKLLFESELARFGFIFGSMLDAGLPIVSALQSLSTSMSTHRYQNFASELSEKVNEGNAFGTLLVIPEYRKMLSGTICQIVISAEKSGNLSSCLLEIGDNYQDKADLTARNLETLLEPIVLVLIAVCVLFIAMAVFLPLYSMVGQFNSSGS